MQPTTSSAGVESERLLNASKLIQEYAKSLTPKQVEEEFVKEMSALVKQSKLMQDHQKSSQRKKGRDVGDDFKVGWAVLLLLEKEQDLFRLIV